MRTTIDFPDPLFRQVKARAALEGRSLKKLVTEYVEQGLRRSSSHVELGRAERRSEIPLARARTGRPIPSLSNAEIERLLTDEEARSADGG